MALASVGLSTHIFNNQLKSVFLLLGFPFLLVMMIAGFFFATEIAWQKSASLEGGRSSLGVLTLLAHGHDPDINATINALPQDGSIDWTLATDAATYGILHYGHWAVLVAGLWFVIAFFFHTRMINASTGARPVTREQFPKIYNMLENLCISRGLAMPTFQVIDSPALNAFASGINEKTYAITLTRGIIEALPDDELEAVIGHELTHIMNRDVRLLIISVVFVGMISFFAEMAFRMMVRGSRPNYYARRGGNRRGGGGAVIILLIAAAILALGYFFAIVIRFALSRKREFLADAGSVELTKNPEAMMRALQRIAGKDRVAGMPDEVQQMCIENSAGFMHMFATHPAIPDRIRALSEMTGTPVPDMTVTLRRAPKRPWDDDHWGNAR